MKSCERCGKYNSAYKEFLCKKCLEQCKQDDYDFSINGRFDNENHYTNNDRIMEILREIGYEL